MKYSITAEFPDGGLSMIMELFGSKSFFLGFIRGCFGGISRLMAGHMFCEIF